MKFNSSSFTIVPTPTAMMCTPAVFRFLVGAFNNSMPSMLFSGVVWPSVTTTRSFFAESRLILWNIPNAFFNASSVLVIPFWYQFLRFCSVWLITARSLDGWMASLATWLKSMTPMRLSAFKASKLSASFSAKSTLLFQFSLRTLPEASSAVIISRGEWHQAP